MTTAYWLQGDTRKVLADLAAAGVVVDLVVTSPPFLKLRSYLPEDDPEKELEIGTEMDPAGFIDTLLDVTEACEGLLAPYGSLCVELGDTYAGSGGAGGDYSDGGLRDGQPIFSGSSRSEHARPIGARAGRVETDGGGWPAAKSLALIPESFRWALAYGRNPFNGRETPRWRIRNSITWARPNPPVGADGDKFRPATSDLVVACRTDESGRTRYWDGDAVRTPHTERHANRQLGQRRSDNGGDWTRKMASGQNPAGAPLLDWWKITAAGYPGSHYATFPPALVIPLVKTMCPERVCMVCGEPSRRIVRIDRCGLKDDSTRVKTGGPLGRSQDRAPEVGWEMRHETIGWTDCHHDAWRPGIVLDPFAGSGTTLSVATGHGRDAVGIDLDRRNADLARDRVGPLLFFQEMDVSEVALALSAQSPVAERGDAA